MLKHLLYNKKKSIPIAPHTSLKVLNANKRQMVILHVSAFLHQMASIRGQKLGIISPCMSIANHNEHSALLKIGAYQMCVKESKDSLG